MLRRQSYPPDIMSFLAGDSEMARRIRERDWKDHPFGPTENWPQSLRSALGICLQSAFPTAIYWGSELRLLYNDAWAPIPGPRHPAALGEPAREVWSDIWHVIEPQFAHLISTGEGIFVEDQMLPMRRYGNEEETYWNYSFTPIRDENGSISGVFNSGNETTQNVMLRRQMSFLLELGEVFRTADAFVTARRTAIRMLGDHIGAHRVGLRVADEEGKFPIVEMWTAPGVAPIDSAIAFEKFGRSVTSHLMAGKLLRMDSSIRNPELEAARPLLGSLGVEAAIAIPWRENGSTVAIIFVHSDKPRAWSDFEISTAEKVLEKIMLWSERERAADRERIMIREIDHRARNALAVAQSVVRLSAAEDINTFRSTIEDRIAALARVHSLMSSERWGPVELTALLKEELAPFLAADSDSVVIAGPSIRLMPERAQTIALLIHELVTNAVKHGALGKPGGNLAVNWIVDQDGKLTFKWVESGKAADRPAGRSDGSGFGTTLITRLIEQQLGGKVSRKLDEDGIRYTFAIPLGKSKETTQSDRDLSGENRTVLIVEDEPIVAMDMENLVEELGYTVLDVATSVAEGLSSLERCKPDFAILDANLRGESSVPIAESLSALGIPIIFATGYTEIKDLPDSLSKAKFLSKPISPVELENAIKQSLS